MFSIEAGGQHLVQTAFFVYFVFHSFGKGHRLLAIKSNVVGAHDGTGAFLLSLPPKSFVGLFLRADCAGSGNYSLAGCGQSVCHVLGSRTASSRLNLTQAFIRWEDNRPLGRRALHLKRSGRGAVAGEQAASVLSLTFFLPLPGFACRVNWKLQTSEDRIGAASYGEKVSDSIWRHPT